MIDELHAQNVALIRDVSLSFAPGLTVLTGETGAGKTALLGALKLMVGERADASVVREGSEQLSVEGRFYLENEEDPQPDGHVVSRRVTADGRGRVEIDGHMASVRELSEGLGTSVDLVGQHAHQQLLDLASHTRMLDAYLADKGSELLASYQAALTEARAAQRELERVEALVRSSSEALAEANFTLARINEVDPIPNEDETLSEQLRIAENAESIISAAHACREALTGDGGATDQISTAMDELSQVARVEPKLGRLSESLNDALIAIEDVALEVRGYFDLTNYDPETLEAMQSRMAQLQGLMRSYGPTLSEVLRHKAQAQERIDAATNGSEQLERAQAALDAAENTLLHAADALEAARKAAAPRLAKQVTEQMTRLEMGTAELEVTVERLPRNAWTSAGPSKVELMYRPGSGMSAKPLRKIASGGEVSRVMLACKVVLGEADHVETLVFDEVDAGVGGATAKALASVLEDLSRTHQVIVVTHLAQVAVAASKHYLVHKTESELPETHIDELSGEARVAEIARMLSGDINESSLVHAQSLLEEAQTKFYG